MGEPASFQTYFFMPPLARISGGMAVMAELAEHLAACGYAVSFVTSGELPAGLAFQIPRLQLGEVKSRPEDRWLVPEGWPNALLPGLKANSRCALYVQNWAFLHGHLPGELDWRSLPVRMLAVSGPVRAFICETTGLDSKIIPPAIDLSLFYPNQKPIQEPGKIRFAWMPRKNKGLARQIRTIFEAMTKTRHECLPEWVAIENLPQYEVAASLRSCQIFLSTGFPEGFGLPPLEAMACGCLVAGFTGMGGWEYMRQALPCGYSPAFELPVRPWGPNGFYAADGDVWGAAVALRTAHELLLGQADPNPIREAAFATAAWYSGIRQKEAILSVWQDESFWRTGTTDAV